MTGRLTRHDKNLARYIRDRSDAGPTLRADETMTLQTENCR
jgi:hypothetical protein